MKRNEKLLEIIGLIDEKHIPEPREVFNINENDGGQEAEMQLSSAYKKRAVPVKAIAFAASLAAAAVIFTVLLKNFPSPMDDPIETAYTSNTTIEGISAQPSGNPLDLIGYYIDEEGQYRVDYNDWEKSDDFDLFRKYFFGSWDNAVGIFGKENPIFVIDDSEKSLIMNDANWRFTGFYKLSENVLAFAMNSNAEMLIFWMDTNSPDIMYADLSNGGWLFFYSTFSTDYKPTVLTKTDAPVNPPEENFLSIYKLYEMSRDYGIDFYMLLDIEYDTRIFIDEDSYFETENGWVFAKLLHDDWYQFYPVYLVSEAPDKLEFKTRIGNIGYEMFDISTELDVEYTIEKTDGKWIRTVKIIYSDGSVTTLPPTNSSGENSLAALELLDYYIDEDGHYQAGVDKWTETQDYDLFRKYFFGVWEGDFPNSTLSSENVPNRMVIDDSEKSTIATDPNIFYSGMFYLSERGTLVFLTGSSGGASMYWTDTNNPGTLYAVDGGIGEHSWIVSYNDGYPKVYTLTKTDEPINEPENGYLSIYRFYELSRDYGISLEELTSIRYELYLDAADYPYYVSENGKVQATLYHDYRYQFNPTYLISEAPDKLAFKTQLGNAYFDGANLDVTYTLEKYNYWWRRTAEITLPGGETVIQKDYNGEPAPPVLYNKLTWVTKTEDLPKISVKPFCYYSVTSQAFSQLDSADANPWQEEKINALPVFKDKYYGIDSTVQGGCTEEKELKRMAEAAAEILGLTVNEDETKVCITYGGLHVKEKEYTEDMGKYPMSVTAYCDGAKYGTELVRITVFYNGEIYIRFGNAETIDDVADMGKDPEGYKLPEGIYWTDGVFTDENVNQNTYTLNYLISEFKDLLQFLNPQINTRTINYSDGKSFSMSVQDAGGSFTEKLLNYNFSAAGFYFNSYDNTELHSIHLQNTLSLLGEYAGDYPIISQEEAKEILLSGKYARQYLESEYRWKGLEYKNIPIDEVENEVINESDIRGVSLVYEGITYDDQEYFQPYYRFYIESEPYYDEDERENMIVQSYYYVPAVNEEYISGVDTSRKY